MSELKRNINIFILLRHEYQVLLCVTACSMPLFGFLPKPFFNRKSQYFLTNS